MAQHTTDGILLRCVKTPKTHFGIYISWYLQSFTTVIMAFQEWVEFYSLIPIRLREMVFSSEIPSLYFNHGKSQVTAEFLKVPILKNSAFWHAMSFYHTRTDVSVQLQ